MTMSNQKKVMLNDVLVDFVSLKINVQGTWLDLEPKQLALLSLLLAKQGQPVSREQIMDTLWEGLIVSDNSVSQLVTQLRKKLRDNKTSPKIIRTVPRYGYQLIADVSEPPTLLEQVTPNAPKKLAIYGLIGITIGVSVTLFLQYLLLETSSSSEFIYRSRITSAPGMEAFVRYSADGRYLAFSHSDESHKQFDLAVYDQQSKTVHSVKNSGYSEEAPVWSPDGKWLAYYRYDPFRCEIRVIAVNGAIETWRLSPESTLINCQPFSAPTRLKWPKSDEIYGITWHEKQPRLIRYTLTKNSPLTVLESELVGNFKPIAFDINMHGQLLILEKQGIWYTLFEVSLTNLDEQRIISRQLYKQYPVMYDHTGLAIWSVESDLKYISHQGQQTVHKPTGFIASLAVDPISGNIAHAEGLAQINAYQLTLSNINGQLTIDKEVKLASSTRMDFMPTLSDDGKQVAFISLERPGLTEFSHAEIWIKHQQRKSANLVAHLPSYISPKYLQFSPDGDTLLLLDERQNVYLINTFSRRLVHVISGFEQLNAVRWSTDSKAILYQAKSTQGEWQDWRYDLQLNTNSLHANNVPLITLSRLQPLWRLNPSYLDYDQLVQSYLSTALEQQVPLSQLLPSLVLYKPAVFKGGIYYVLRVGHQVSLYCYSIAEEKNIFIKDLGIYNFDISVDLTLNTSLDGKQLVFSQVEGIETDILLHQVVN